MTCRAALPTTSIGMSLLHTQHSHGDMRPADPATVSGASFHTASYFIYQEDINNFLLPRCAVVVVALVGEREV